MKRILTTICAAGVLLSGCGGSSGPHGFYNMRALGDDLEVQLDSNAPDLSGYVHSIQCIRAGQQTAKCYIVRDSGQTSVATVSISSNGMTYISS